MQGVERRVQGGSLSWLRVAGVLIGQWIEVRVSEENILSFAHQFSQ
jgi:hypothetical protein